MALKQIDIGAELSKGWNVFKLNMGVLIVAGVIATLLTLVTCLVLSGPLSAGLFLVVRRLIQNDPVKPQAGDVFKGLDYFLQSFLLMLACFVVSLVCSLVLGIVPILGQLASIVLSLALNSLMMWALMFVAYEKRTAMEAVKKAVASLKAGEFTVPLLFGVLASLVSNVGMLACGVGVFFTIPIGYCMMACCYQTLYGDEAQVIEPEVAPTPPPDDLRL
ncbi:MAG: hypothetical protein PHV28_04780 [Kiritimatiellae bacterium]|nr:hypothetical protein [Kiritimatiellia bacterium]